MHVNREELLTNILGNFKVENSTTMATKNSDVKFRTC